MLGLKLKNSFSFKKNVYFRALNCHGKMISRAKYLIFILFLGLSNVLLSQPTLSGNQSVASGSAPLNYTYDLNIAQSIGFSFCYTDSGNYTYINIPFSNEGIEIIHEILITVYNSSNQIVSQHLWSGQLTSGATSNISIGPIPYMVGMQSFYIVSQNTIAGEQDQNPSNDTATINAERFPRMIINPLPNIVICPNVTLPISAMQGFLNYSWSTGGNQNIEFISDSGVYSVTYTNNYGCTVSDTFNVGKHPSYESIINSDIYFCENDSVQELALGGFVQYSWSTGDNQQLVTFSQSGAYTITVLDSNDCETVDTINVHKVQLPILELDSVYSFCENDSITISPLNNALSLIWDGASSGNSKIFHSSGFHTISAIGAYNCVIQKNFQVIENPLPKPNLGEDTILCEGENKQLFAGAFEQYFWSTGSQNQFITINQPGTYSITVVDSNSCSNVSEINLTLLSIIISPLNDTVLCVGDAFNVNPVGNFDFFQWNDGQTIGINRLISQPGVYTLNTALGGKCYKTVSFEVKSKTTPASDFSFVNSGNTVQFYNLSTQFDSLNWSFGDNTNSTGNNPIHSYQTDGVYLVRLTTQNICGLSFVEKELVVNSLNNNNHYHKEEITIYPNPATDVIKVKSNLNKKLLVSIYDVTGKLLLEKILIGITESYFNTYQLSKGMYIITISDDSQLVSTQKIVIE